MAENNTSNIGFEKQIWDAACVLRGNIDASEYKSEMCIRDRNEDLLYKLFGKNAELLIDHAWGWEPTTIEAIKAYRPSSNSLSSGQVLHCPYAVSYTHLVQRS